MFWNKQKQAKDPKQVEIIKLYLAGSTILLSSKNDKIAARTGAQVFILGMIDMLRNVEGLSWEEFVAVYEAALKYSGLMPGVPVTEFVQTVGEHASRQELVARLLQEGAQSIKMYVAERDADAPLDLLRAVHFAESNERIFSSIEGAA